MGTILVIVEFLIIGFQVMVWLGLLLWPDVKEQCAKLVESPNSAPLVVMGVVAAAYTLGVVFDRSIGHLSTLIQALINSRKKEKASENASPKESAETSVTKLSPEALKKRVFLRYPHYQAHLVSYNQRVRLLRAKFLNGVIIFTLMLWKDTVAAYDSLGACRRIPPSDICRIERI